MPENIWCTKYFIISNLLNLESPLTDPYPFDEVKLLAY